MSRSEVSPILGISPSASLLPHLSSMSLAELPSLERSYCGRLAGTPKGGVLSRGGISRSDNSSDGDLEPFATAMAQGNALYGAWSPYY